MLQIKTDILCNGKVMFGDIDVWLKDWKRSQSGRFYAPYPCSLELSLPFAIRLGDRTIGISFTRINVRPNQVEIGFDLQETIPLAELAPSDNKQ
ncbi:MAG: hypothetical protein JO360_05695 [Acidobacteria bacterium]|nr:hypothetical protein [Acidobacteriota bacterium]